MPQIGLNMYNPGVTNLIPSQIAQRQQKLAEREANMAKIQKVFQAIQQYGQMKQQTAKQEKMLKGLGVLKDVQETAEPGTPEWNKIAESMMKKNVVVSRASGALPTGKTNTIFNQEALQNLPEGIELKDIFGITGMNVKGVKPEKLSYTDSMRQDLSQVSERIEAGEDSQEVLKEITEKYPSGISADTHYNLKQIAKEAEGKFLKKQQVDKKQNIVLRKQAIQELKQAGYPITETNIKSAIGQLQGQ